MPARRRGGGDGGAVKTVRRTLTQAELRIIHTKAYELLPAVNGIDYDVRQIYLSRSAGAGYSGILRSRPDIIVVKSNNLTDGGGPIVTADILSTVWRQDRISSYIANNNPYQARWSIAAGDFVASAAVVIGMFGALRNGESDGFAAIEGTLTIALEYIPRASYV